MLNLKFVSKAEYNKLRKTLLRKPIYVDNNTQVDVLCKYLGDNDAHYISIDEVKNVIKYLLNKNRPYIKE